MRFNKWPFRRFSLSQLFIDIRNNSNKSFVCPLTSGGETSTHCRAAEQNVLSAPPLLSPWCALWCSALCRMCTARFPVWLQHPPPCAHVQPSRTRMGETAARRSKRQEGSSPDNLFQETMVGQPSTWPPVSTHLSSQVAGFAKSFGQQRLQVVGRPDCSGVSPFWRLGPEMVGRWVLARPHTAFTNHRSHTSLDRRWPGGEEGAGQTFQDPEMDPGQSRVLPTVSLTPLVEECCIVGDYVVTNQE